MKWINYFSNLNIPFYIYKLNTSDSIIYSRYIKVNQPMIILHGIVYILKNFTNKKTTTLAILKKGNIIYINQIKETNCYYKVIAITTTFFISFQWKNLININNNINSQIFKEFIKLYIKTKNQYEIMNSIITHKYIKNRLIQLILIFSRDFGIINKTQITIYHYISQKNIGIIIGSNRTTVNKILNYLNYYKFIQYSSDKKIIINKPFFFLYSNNKKIKKYKP
nr:global nitrogen transcriptional regulator [Calliblepharis sp.]